MRARTVVERNASAHFKPAASAYSRSSKHPELASDMVTRVLIIGGYGNFGRSIASSLAADAEISASSSAGGRPRRPIVAPLHYTLSMQHKAMRSI